MSPVTITWSMIASACLTLAVIYGLVWYRNRRGWAHLFFALTALATTGLAFGELSIMRATTLSEVVTARTWTNVPLTVWIVTMVWFVRFRLGTGRIWLAWTICALRAVALAAHFVVLQNPGLPTDSTLRQITFLGESVTVLSGIPNPLAPLTQFTTVLLMLFVADASVSAWRRGDRRKTLILGVSVEFFLLAGFGTAVAIVWLGAEMPMAFSPFYLGLLAVMAHELSRDLLRSAQLVDDLKTRETELRESEERMALAVEVADLAIWTRDLVSEKVWASPRWRAIFGFSESEPLNPEGIRQRVHPDDLVALTMAQERALAGASGGAYQIDYRVVRPDGSARWIASHARVERDADGRPIRMRGASRDITDRKRGEEEALLLRQEVAHVGRVSMLGQLASSLAHEINQPLGAILRNAEAAELFLARPSPDLDEIRAILEDIRRDDQRAGAVIDRMRALLKRDNLDARPLSVGDLVGDVLALARVDAQFRQVRLLADVPRDLPAARGDRVHLQQVLLNLMINGMDAVVGAWPSDRRVQVSARLNGGGAIEVGVADSGQGIPTDQLAQVFEPFFTTKANGMGMGLPLSRTIIEAHGGKLWAENAAGGGAIFRFTLPTAQP